MIGTYANKAISDFITTALAGAILALLAGLVLCRRSFSTLRG